MWSGKGEVPREGDRGEVGFGMILSGSTRRDGVLWLEGGGVMSAMIELGLRRDELIDQRQEVRGMEVQGGGGSSHSALALNPHLPIATQHTILHGRFIAAPSRQVCITAEHTHTHRVSHKPPYYPKMEPQIQLYHSSLPSPLPGSPSFVFHLTYLTNTLFIWIGTGQPTEPGHGSEPIMVAETKVAQDWAVAMPQRPVSRPLWHFHTCG